VRIITRGTLQVVAALTLMRCSCGQGQLEGAGSQRLVASLASGAPAASRSVGEECSDGSPSVCIAPYSHLTAACVKYRSDRPGRASHVCSSTCSTDLDCANGFACTAVMPWLGPSSPLYCFPAPSWEPQVAALRPPPAPPAPFDVSKLPDPQLVSAIAQAAMLVVRAS
jgi:hypothetical protein